MNELFPILSGILLGSSLGYVRPELRARVAMVFAVLFGAAATLISGEFRLSWSFLFVDVTIVIISAAIAFAVVRSIRAAR